MNKKVILLILCVLLVVVAVVPFSAFAESNTFSSQPCIIPVYSNCAFSPDGSSVSYFRASVCSSITLERSGDSFRVFGGYYNLFDGSISGGDIDSDSDLIYDVSVPFRDSSAVFFGGSDFNSVNGDLFAVYYFDTVFKFYSIGDVSSLMSFLNTYPNARPELFALRYDKAKEDGSFFTYEFNSGRSLSFKWWVTLDIFYSFDGSQSIGLSLSFPALYQQFMTPSLFYVGSDMNGTFDSGFAQGYESAFNTVDENSASYKSGYDVAKTEWYAKGFAKGENEGKTLFGYLAGVAQAPIDFLKESLSFELLGVSIYDFVCSILTVCALLVVIKAVSGV